MEGDLHYSTQTMTNTELASDQLRDANGAHQGFVCPMSSFSELSDISRNLEGIQKLKASKDSMLIVRSKHHLAKGKLH